MIYGSVCSGIEAASVAWEGLGWTPAFFAEIDRAASAVLAHRWPQISNIGDFTKVDANSYGIDLLVGGTPCQAFSLAGSRRSLDDERGNLTLQFVKLVHATRTLRWVVWENVPGVLSTKDNAFGCFLGGLVGSDDPLRVPGGKRWPDAGMVAGPLGRAAWRVLDAQYFGLAQRRRRVFVVFSPTAAAGDPAAVLFERQGLSRNPPPRPQPGEGSTHALAPSLTASGRGVERAGETRGQDPVVAVAFGGNNTSGPIDVATAVNAHGGPHGRLDFESETFIAVTAKDYGGDAGPISPTLRAGGFTGSHANGGVMPAVAFNWQGGGVQTSLGFDPEAGITGALSVGQTPAVVATYGVRRLTPAECERLQGFPDGHTRIPIKHLLSKPRTKHFLKNPDLYDHNADGTWTRFADDGPRYKQCGNSMAVKVMRWIGGRIQAQEEFKVAA